MDRDLDIRTENRTQAVNRVTFALTQLMIVAVLFLLAILIVTILRVILT